jgi:hypothetical protein
LPIGILKKEIESEEAAQIFEASEAGKCLTEFSVTTTLVLDDESSAHGEAALASDVSIRTEGRRESRHSSREECRRDQETKLNHLCYWTSDFFNVEIDEWGVNCTYSIIERCNRERVKRRMKQTRR